MMKSNAQGSMEYLVIIAAVLAVSAVVVYFMMGSAKSSISDSNFAQCKKAASECKSSHLLSPNDPCIDCETACTVNGVDILDGTGFSAVDLCKQGLPNEVYKRDIIECGNGKIEQGEVCDSDTVQCSELDPNYVSGTATCLDDCSGYNESNCQTENNAPVLSSASVSPTSGAAGDTYRYSVKYSDPDNDEFKYVTLFVYIDSDLSNPVIEENMTCYSGSGVTDPDYGDCYYDAVLGIEGNYYYKFEAEDERGARTVYSCGSDFCEGPGVGAPGINQAPVLSNADVSPSSGSVGEVFFYHVTYSDADGDSPLYLELHIQGPVSDLVNMNCNGDPVSGMDCLAEYYPPAQGTYSFYFSADDGYNYVEYHCEDLGTLNGECEGPIVS